MTTKSINDRLGHGGLDSVAVFDEDESGQIVQGLISPLGDVIKIPFLVSQSFVPVVRTSQNSIIDPNDDTDYMTLASISVPAGIMGINSRLVLTAYWDYISSASVKTLAVDWGGSNVAAPTYTTTGGVNNIMEICNAGSLTAQKILNSNTYGSATAAVHTSAAKDTSAAVAIDLKCKWSGATLNETITLLGFSIWHYPGND